ncbi:MAG: tetratricopeptide repeat protein [Alphaproteobacteria bacterium]
MKSSIDEMLARARAAGRSGDPTRSRQLLRDMLARFPSNARVRAALTDLEARIAIGGTSPDALASLARLQAQGRHLEMLALGEELVARSGESPALLNFVGIGQATLGRLEAAAGSFLRAASIDPGYFDAWNNLGNVLRGLGRPADAIVAYGRAGESRPDDAEVPANLAAVFLDLGRHAEALESCDRAIVRKPSHAEALASRAAALLGLGRDEEALASAERALAARPASGRAHALRGVALHRLGRLDEALRALERGGELNPSDPDTLVFKANVLEDLRRLDEAFLSLDRAVALGKGHALALNNRGNVLMRLGRVAEAAHDFASAGQALGDAWPRWRGNEMLVLNYLERLSPQEIAQAHRRFGDALEAFAVKEDPPAPPRDADRPLRIGYVSADFRSHSVGCFIEGVLAAHDPRDVEVFAYANQRVDDAVTARMRAHASGWRDVSSMDDATMAAAIRADAIDVLVDLSGHTAGNRLPVFVRRPAPVQATWIGYPQTTGLSCIDWLVADPVVLPPADEPLYRERVMRLPGCYLCWAPPRAARTPPPALSRGHVTFASFNALQKISHGTLAAWARILSRVPAARLLLKAEALAGGATRSAVRADFAAVGGDPERLDLEGHLPRAEHDRRFADVDIMLDPFPYNGCTSTVEAIGAGVPVVSLRGRGGMMTRSGETLLSACGLPDWLAADVDAYVEIAVSRASNVPALAELRMRLDASPISDAPRFARDLEHAYRAMWRDWCARSG